MPQNFKIIGIVIATVAAIIASQAFNKRFILR